MYISTIIPFVFKNIYIFSYNLKIEFSSEVCQSKREFIRNQNISKYKKYSNKFIIKNYIYIE